VQKAGFVEARRRRDVGPRRGAETAKQGACMIPVEGKGRSPFFPNQPVPIDLFVGRTEQIERIITLGVDRAVVGRPTYLFLEGRDQRHCQ